MAMVAKDLKSAVCYRSLFPFCLSFIVGGFEVFMIKVYVLITVLNKIYCVVYISASHC